MDKDKKAALVMILRGNKGSGNGPKDGSGPLGGTSRCPHNEDNKENEEEEDKEKYEAFGADLLSAIESKDKERVGEVLANIVRSMK